MIRSLFSLCVAVLLYASWHAPAAGAATTSLSRPSQQHQVWFKGTQYELNVYRIYGRRPGKTMLIIGGIQGDEPGGFLSADLYVDTHLNRGDLIVIPRANFKSVILYQRGPDGDMNRQFHKRHNGTLQPSFIGVVQVIQDLMAESDIFLNLHDGRGFYHPTYLDENRNPQRFGQSIVIDTNEFICRDTGKKIELAATAAQVLTDINDRIENTEHQLHLFNTRTDIGTDYIASEMKKTATWFALTQHCIPSFGIESSKDLPTTELKVRYHNDAINAFMAHYGIMPDFPPLLLPPPTWSYLLFSINDEIKTVFPGKQIFARPGDIISIKHVEANYQRGITCDLKNIGNMNDLGHDFVLTSPTKLVIRKDQRVIGTIDILLVADAEKSVAGWQLALTVNGKNFTISDKNTLTLRRKDIVILKRAYNSADVGSTPLLNFKGFVPSDVNINTGDDGNHPIVLDDSLMKRFSVGGNGRRWPIVATKNGTTVAHFYIETE